MALWKPWAKRGASATSCSLKRSTAILPQSSLKSHDVTFQVSCNLFHWVVSIADLRSRCKPSQETVQVRFNQLWIRSALWRIAGSWGLASLQDPIQEDGILGFYHGNLRIPLCPFLTSMMEGMTLMTWTSEMRGLPRLRMPECRYNDRLEDPQLLCVLQFIKQEFLFFKRVL